MDDTVLYRAVDNTMASPMLFVLGLVFAIVIVYLVGGRNSRKKG